jgi:hypothetical protein
VIKQGEVAFIKTTGEAVYVLDFHDPSPKLGDKELLVSVRRPVAGQDGIEHRVSEFRLGELETLDEQQTRFMSERKKVMEKYGPKGDTPSSEDAGFPIN